MRTLRASPLLVLCFGGTILALAVGMRQSFGLFLLPIISDLGWGRETFSLAIAIQNLVWGLTQPFFAMAADRWGTHRAVMVGGVLYTIGLYFMASPSGAVEFSFTAGVLIGLALSGTGFVVILGAVGRAYGPAKRSIALGIVSACGSFGQFAMAPIGQGLIDTFGWSSTLLVFAVLGAITALLAIGMRPPQSHGADQGQQQSMRTAMHQAAVHSGYIYLTAGFFVCGFQITFIIGHLPAYLQDIGLNPATAATALGLIGLFNIVGSLGWGILGSRFRKKYLLSGLYIARAVITVMLLTLPVSAWNAYLFASVMGLLWLGTIPLTNALIADIFGTRYLTSLFGVVFLGHQVGAFLGIWLGGYVFDVVGSYDVIWWLIVGLGIAAAALHMPIDDRPLQRVATA